MKQTSGYTGRKKVYFPLGAEHLANFIDDDHVDNFTWMMKHDWLNTQNH
jgi:hypothetical protein